MQTDTSPEPLIANVEMAAAWDGPEGEHWADQADRYEATSARYRQRLLSAVPAATDLAILDIGCGTGRSTRDLAKLVSSGSVVGVDLSARMLERARAAARGDGLSNVRFEQADAQVHAFPEQAFDLAVSSFGAMFFADPVTAFTNIASSLRPGGTLVMLVWRDLQLNEWVAAIRDALAVGRELPLPPVDAPGPFGLARREHAERILSDAGFVKIEFEEVNESIRFGDDADDAFSFVKTFGITRGLTQDLDEAGKEAALAALHAVLVDHHTPDGALFGASAWLITARVDEGPARSA